MSSMSPEVDWWSNRWSISAVLKEDKDVCRLFKEEFIRGLVLGWPMAFTLAVRDRVGLFTPFSMLLEEVSMNPLKDPEICKRGALLREEAGLLAVLKSNDRASAPVEVCAPDLGLFVGIVAATARQCEATRPIHSSRYV